MEKQDYIKLANNIIKKFKDLDSLKHGITLDEEGNYIIKLLNALYNKGYKVGYDEGWNVSERFSSGT